MRRVGKVFEGLLLLFLEIRAEGAENLGVDGGALLGIAQDKITGGAGLVGVGIE